MIEIFNLTKSYGEQLLFKEASFTIMPGDRIGLVGRNGHGKSTLLRMIIGEEEIDEGRISIPKNYTIGYLRQILSFTENTVTAEASKGLPEHEKDAFWKTEKILTGLGFKEEDLSKPPGIFSGGYQMRIELAKVLVSEPNMLLLDEPTNFLDIVSIRWLEKFLREWKSELMIVSHDRNFVDSVTTHIVGIHRARMRKFEGGTAKFYSCIEQEDVVHEKRRLEDEKKRKEIEEYINRFKSQASRASTVQSSMKMLEKMEKIDKLGTISTLSFSFNSTPFSPPVVMEATDISFSYDGGIPYLFDKLDFVVARGEKICIVGPNGKGKTTLARILAGVLTQTSGKIRINPQVVMSYYEQGNTARLDNDRTIEEEVIAAHPYKNRGEARGICGAMMFPGDMALKKISVLSGGERSRVLLAKTLLIPSNLLILDEPTHHLDMESCAALFEAVKKYDGAAIVVTHDEYFLHKVATKLIVFTGERIKVFPGNYSEFLAQVGWGDGALRAAAPRLSAKTMAPESPVNKKDERRRKAELAELRRKKLGPLEEKMKKLEKEIHHLEKEETALTEELIKGSEEQNVKVITEVPKKLNALKLTVNRLYEELELVSESYEKAKKEFE
ncbi:MAG: ABC-F family ATP-binding cassette domain-containing protein [Candidatus Omnitrophica bacterium]|nr:ABC-F family ATP-binding cassette domain-containing protein [Candidatus Omnitrophota bacterium]